MNTDEAALETAMYPAGLTNLGNFTSHTSLPIILININ